MMITNVQVARAAIITQHNLPFIRYLLLLTLLGLSYITYRRMGLVLKSVLIAAMALNSVVISDKNIVPAILHIYCSALFVYVTSCISIRYSRPDWLDGFANGVLMSGVIMGTYFLYCVW